MVGLGGLGSPCALYLAAAGVGKLGFVDFDRVDTSNLHRQIIHTENRQGMFKVESAKMACLAMNSSIQIETYTDGFQVHNALELVQQYDVIVDCSDNVTTRYMVNDACVLCNKPLVSASSVRMEGQLTVYHYDEQCPCYRCLFPNPPPAETVTNCSDGGVLGVAPGIMGSLQALEVQKILMGMKEGVLARKMILFNAKETSFRTIKLRNRQENCAICGKNPTITSIQSVESVNCLNIPKITLEEQNRISTVEYNEKLYDKNVPHLLLDVREKHQYDICCLEQSINIPLKQLSQNIEKVEELIKEKHGDEISPKDFPIYVVCRRGIASVSGTKILLDNGFTNVKNIDGGVTSWKVHVDENFPGY